MLIGIKLIDCNPCRVISGFEVLDAMEKVPVGQKDRPLQSIVLNSVTIHANPIAEVAL